MSHFKRVVAVFLLMATALLSACGGGGKADVTLPNKGVALATSAASAISLQVGSASTFNISGGGGGSQFTSYSASSSNPSLAKAAVSGSTLTITALAAGNGNIIVTDTASNSVTIGFTVTPGSSPIALKVNAPSPLNIGVNAISQYAIIGGVLPYSVASSNMSVANATVTGSTLNLVGISAGSANIAVFDATGTGVTIAVVTGNGNTPASPLFTTAPAAVGVSINSNASFVVGGGTPPYTVTTGNSSVASVSNSGANFSIQGVSAGATTVVVTDSVGANIKISVGVSPSAATPLQTTSPSAIVMAPSTSSNYMISGGVGPYSVSVSNPSVLSASASGATLTINGLTVGSGTVVVFDSTGTAVQISVSVSNGSTALYSTAPAAVTLIANGAAGNYLVSGGNAPYTAVSSATSVVTASMNGSALTLAGVARGTATVAIHDASGALVSIAVTVN